MAEVRRDILVNDTRRQTEIMNMMKKENLIAADPLVEDGRRRVETG